LKIVGVELCHDVFPVKSIAKILCTVCRRKSQLMTNSSLLEAVESKQQAAQVTKANDPWGAHKVLSWYFCSIEVNVLVDKTSTLSTDQSHFSTIVTNKQ